MWLATSLTLLLMTATPAELTALRGHRDAEEKKADLLARDGKYGEAIEVLEALQVELQTKLKDVPQKEQEGAYLATSLSVLPSREWSGAYSEIVIRDPPPRIASVLVNAARILSSCARSARRSRRAPIPPSWDHCGNRRSIVLLVAGYGY